MAQKTRLKYICLSDCVVSSTRVMGEEEEEEVWGSVEEIAENVCPQRIVNRIYRSVTYACVYVYVLLNLRISLSFFDVFPGLFFGQQEGDSPCLWLQIHHPISFSTERFNLWKILETGGNCLCKEGKDDRLMIKKYVMLKRGTRIRIGNIERFKWRFKCENKSNQPFVFVRMWHRIFDIVSKR